MRETNKTKIKQMEISEALQKEVATCISHCLYQTSPEDISKKEVVHFVDAARAFHHGQKNRLNTATAIVELFEDLLDEKQIVIPCGDKDEEEARCDLGNDAKLYGMEYWSLVENIEALLQEN